MDKTEIFRILGIESDTDEKTIRNAYHARLAMTNPEDDQEGFMRLREAYEAACRMVRMSQDGEDGKKVSEVDLTPSGRWMEKVAQVYGSLKTRKDVESWKKLFNDDCFVSLDEEENCRIKLFTFLMSNFRLPTDVWRLLDKELGILKDKAFLKEHFRLDFVHFITSRCEHGEDVDFEQFRGADDAPYDSFLQIYDKCVLALRDSDFDLAKRYIDSADELDIRHPVMENCRAQLLAGRGDTEGAVRILEDVLRLYPEDEMLSYNLAEILWKRGDEDPHSRDRAAAIYEELKRKNPDHYMANLRLAGWYCDNGRYHEAKECAEKVLFPGGDSVFMELLARINAPLEEEYLSLYRESGGWEPALNLCWCYLQDGKVNKGIRLAREICGLLPPDKKSEYYGLMAKLYWESADYKESAAMAALWERELSEKLSAPEYDDAERDRHRLRQAHLIRIQCMHCMGLTVEALGECEKALEGSFGDVGILLEMARIFAETGEYERCRSTAEKLADEYMVYVGFTSLLEASYRMRSAGDIIGNGNICLSFFPGYTRAYEYMAEVYFVLERSDDFKALMERAEKNEVKSVILDAYRYLMSNEKVRHARLSESEVSWKISTVFQKNYLEPLLFKGHIFCYESGLTVINDLLYRLPKAFVLVARAEFYYAARRYEQAKEDYEKAVSMSPYVPRAWHGLGRVYISLGNYDRALACTRRAVLYMRNKANVPAIRQTAVIYSLLGDYAAALEACGQYEECGGEKDGEYIKLKTEILINLGNAKDALSFCVGACAGQEKKWDLYRKQVMICALTGQGEDARRILGEWKKQTRTGYGVASFLTGGPKDVSGRMLYNAAGWTELLCGSPQEALKAFEISIRGLKFCDRESDVLIGDAVFAAAVCGDKKRSIRWGKLLKTSINRRSFSSGDEYFQTPRRERFLRMLAELSVKEDEIPEKMHEEAEKCGICMNCSRRFCGKMESIGILMLIRRGRKQDAQGRLDGILEEQPGDRRLLAIRHVIFNDKL